MVEFIEVLKFWNSHSRISSHNLFTLACCRSWTRLSLVSSLVWLLRLWVAVCCVGMGCIWAGHCWRMVIVALNRLIVVLIPAYLLITWISLLSLLLVLRGRNCRLGISHLRLSIRLLGLCLVNRLLVNWLWGSVHRCGLLVSLGLRSCVSLTIVRLLRLCISLLWLAIGGLRLGIGSSLGLGIRLLGLSLIICGSLVVALMVQPVAKTEPGTVEGRAETKAKTVTIAAPEGTISAITTTISALIGRAISVTVGAVSTISTVAAITVFAITEVSVSSVVPWVEERPKVVVVAVVVSLSVTAVVLPGLLVLLTPPLVVVIVVIIMVIMIVLAPALVPVIMVLVHFTLVMPLVVLTMVSLAVSPVFAKMTAPVVSGIQVGSVVKGQWQQVIASVVVA